MDMTPPVYLVFFHPDGRGWVYTKQPLYPSVIARLKGRYPDAISAMKVASGRPDVVTARQVQWIARQDET